MLKKLTLVLLLGSVVAQPVMAASIDTVALKACQGALQGVKQVDMDAFINCLEKAKEANSNQLSKVLEFVSENSVACVTGGLALGALLFYTLIWPDVAIRISYQKNSRAELQAARR